MVKANSSLEYPAIYGTSNDLNKSYLSFKVFPNPTSGVLTVEMEEIPQKVILCNLIGVKVKEIYPGDTRFVLDMSSEYKGIYFLKFYMVNGLQVQKRITLK